MTPIGLRPYRVLVAVSFATTAQFSQENRGKVVESFRESLVRSVGEMWRLEVRDELRFAVAGSAVLRRLTVGDVKEHFSSDMLDKLFLFTIESQGGGFLLAGREWDVTLEQLSPLGKRFVSEQRDVASGLHRLCRQLFRPMAEIDQPPTGNTTLKMWGGEFVPPDADWQLIDGAWFESYYRYLNADREVQRIQLVPWTYLSVKQPERGQAKALVVSGLRQPLSTRRRRVELWALGIGQTGNSTQLTLVAPAPSRKPQVGLEVELTNGIDEREPGRVTDRHGRVNIPNAGAAPLWLGIHSGQALLARVPYIPGLRHIETLELPDDSLRLSVEGDVAILQAELVDLVARRAMLAAEARERAKATDWPKVDALLKELRELPGPGVFAAELNGIRIPALQTARARQDRAAETRIQKLCDETTGLITRYLNADKLRAVQEELDELRKAAAENKAALEGKVK